MRIGPYDIFSVDAGRFALDGGSMFGIVPRTIWGKQIAYDDENRIPLATRSLLIAGNGRIILVDTGIGDKYNEKQRSNFQVDNGIVNLQMSLKKHGVSCEDVTDVICTHLHFDHAGGNTLIDDTGKLVPTFPNATYWIQKANWAVANSPSPKDRASYRWENFKPLVENGMVELVDGEQECIPGIKLTVTNGHTAGQQLPRISDGSHTVFFLADLVPTVHHLKIPWVMAYDNRPLQTMKEKQAILAKAAEENWILLLQHDISQEAIQVEFDGKHYRARNNIKIGS